MDEPDSKLDVLVWGIGSVELGFAITAMVTWAQSHGAAIAALCAGVLLAVIYFPLKARWSWRVPTVGAIFIILVACAAYRIVGPVKDPPLPDEDRARISIGGPFVIPGDTPTVGQTLHYALTERNTGRSPAVQLQYIGLTAKFLDNTGGEVSLPDLDVNPCDSAAPNSNHGVVINPTSDPLLDATGAPVRPYSTKISDDIVGPGFLHQVLYVKGCAVYLSLDKWRKTPICYYARPEQSPVGEIGFQTFQCGGAAAQE